jgi:ankyrin repeat protein
MASPEEFFKAVKGGDLAAVQGMLQQVPSLKDARTEKGLHAVVLAIYYGQKDIADVILRHGPELTIHDASTVGDFGRVKQLVAQDPALVNSLSSDGFTPLGLAAFTGRLEIAEFLLAQGAEANIVSQDENQFTPLTGAVASGNAAVVKLLLMHGADPNHLYEGGQFSPLLEAASAGRLGIIDLLLRHGADVNLRSKDGKSPLGVAREHGHTAVAEALVNAGATE